MSEWSAVVPVRGWETGKSRLGIPGIARAMALDTIDSLLACHDIAEVLVVTRDPVAGTDVRERGCSVVVEPPDADLNEAIHVASRDRSYPPLIVALGDLPCIRPDDVSLALSRCADSPSFISDAHGTGTTVWMIREGDARTHFGARSRARHRFAGATELMPHAGDDPSTWARLRRDVDDKIDLADASRLGLGQLTSSVVPI